MVTADSLYVSGGLSKTQLRNKNDKSSCFRPLCTGSVWDTRVIGRTVQCVSCKHHSVSPTSSVVVTCQIQLQRSSWDWFQELPCTTGNNEWSVRLFIILVHVSISVSVLKNSRLLEQILTLFFFVFNCADLTDEFPPIHVIFSAQFPVLSCSAFYWFTGKKIPVSKSLCTVCFGSTNRSIALLRGLEMRCDRDGPGVTCQRKFCLPFVTSGWRSRVVTGLRNGRSRNRGSSHGTGNISFRSTHT